MKKILMLAVLGGAAFAIKSQLPAIKRYLPVVERQLPVVKRLLGMDSAT